MATLMFFSVTGVTLNHPEWGPDSAREISREGSLPIGLLNPEVDKLAVAERLRAEHGLRGVVDEFRIDENECSVVWKGPGYTADAVMRRTDGEYMLRVGDEGAFGFVNDLHKGRGTGRGWARVIDVSGIALGIVAASGLGLVWFLKRIRIAGFLATLGGVLALGLLILLLVK